MLTFPRLMLQKGNSQPTGRQTHTRSNSVDCILGQKLGKLKHLLAEESSDFGHVPPAASAPTARPAISGASTAMRKRRAGSGELGAVLNAALLILLMGAEAQTQQQQLAPQEHAGQQKPAAKPLTLVSGTKRWSKCANTAH
ncbi:Hypothetical predicted protein [Cloeon dipterum]|uniref:Uncharacterized protein n=1 Tax=Cloeon dipterum TaxID=197152 RepID=A0A8S1CWE4_9INSE|nr:Hypothetical predicted protein [Cloeon dipterum]